jgi:hypothetical protein
MLANMSTQFGLPFDCRAKWLVHRVHAESAFKRSLSSTILFEVKIGQVHIALSQDVDGQNILPLI